MGSEKPLDSAEQGRDVVQVGSSPGLKHILVSEAPWAQSIVGGGKEGTLSKECRATRLLCFGKLAGDAKRGQGSPERRCTAKG